MTQFDWRSLADPNRYRPTDPRLLAREARRLASQGFTPRDVETALRLRPGEARALLERPQ
jgi:hypothetical protein